MTTSSTGTVRKVLKRRTPHGMGRVPVVIGLAESRPRFQMPNGDRDAYNSYYGQGFYHASRYIFSQQNFMYSVITELSHRSIKPALILQSRDGTFTLDEGDPRVAGQQTSTSTENEEKILGLPPMEMVQTAATLLGVIASEMQRGTFPSSAFGELAFQLSGFAITKLGQDLLAPMTPHIRAVRRATKQILDLFRDAYASGQFDAMELSGRRQDPRRAYFSEVITPEMVKAGGNIEVEILPDLPQDDASKVSLAQLLRTPGPDGFPVTDDRFLRENVLQFQDVEQMERAIWEQMADRGSPLAKAYNSMKASFEQGNMEMAEFWAEEVNISRMMKFLEMLQLAALGGGGMGQSGASSNGGGGEGSPARPRLPSSSVMPPEEVGRGSGPTGQAGALVAPGTPRMGARGDGINPSVMGF